MKKTVTRQSSNICQLEVRKYDTASNPGSHLNSYFANPKESLHLQRSEKLPCTISVDLPFQWQFKDSVPSR